MKLYIPPQEKTEGKMGRPRKEDIETDTGNKLPDP
jgi:hypothetical protein